MTRSTSPGRAAVVVVGGGYGGSAAAKALDADADVVLVEAKDAFMHNVAALRALVDPAWVPRIFLPYDRLLARGRVVADRAVRVEPGCVVTASGQEFTADYVVLATGSRYPFPAKSDLPSTAQNHAAIADAYDALKQAERVLVLGAGPVGIELVGEIRAAWPDKAIVLVDASPDVLPGPYLPALRAELRRQLESHGVDIVAGAALEHVPPTEPGELGTFTVPTTAGVRLSADIWFRCFGVRPNSDILAGTLRDAVQRDGSIAVEPTLQVVGHPAVFAIGDVSNADAKMAGFARRQAATVAANVLALHGGARGLENYEPLGPALVVPIGPAGGAGQLPGASEIIGPAAVAERKGRDLMVERFHDQFGLRSDALSVPATSPGRTP